MSDEPALELTEAAATKIKEFVDGESTAGGVAALRVDVVGGADSGFAYDIFFDSEESDDYVLEQFGVRILVRPDALPYLKGSKIDWIEGDNGAGFWVDNPNEPEK